MSTQLNLKEIELRAIRSTYEDGLWDIYFGLIVVCMSIFIYRPASGYSPTNIILAVLAMSVAYSLFWAAKKYITVPRMGQVEFGAQRQKRKLTLAIVLGVVVLVQVAFLAFQAAARANPDLGGLGEVHPFGEGVFEKRASELREKLQKIHFTGDKAELVSPDQSLWL